MLNKIIPLGIPLSWLNLVAEKKRFFAAVAGITFAVTMMMFQLGLNSALMEQVVSPHLKMSADIVLVNQQYEYFGISRGFTKKRLTQTLAHPSVDSIASLYLMNLPVKHPESGKNRDIFVMAFDPVEQPFADPEILKYQSQLKIPGSALFDVRSRIEFGDYGQLLQDADQVSTELNGAHIDVVGLFEMGTTFAADGNLILGVDTFLKAYPVADRNMISVGVVQLKAGASADAVAAELREYLKDDVQILTRQEFIAKEQTYWSERTPIGFVITASMIVSLIVGAVIVYQILYTDVTDHLEEYATLKSIGFKDSFFINLVLQESVILSVFGFLPGALLTLLLYYLTREYAFMPTYLTWDKVGIVLGLTVFMCGVAGALATRKLRHANPADIF